MGPFICAKLWTKLTIIIWICVRNYKSEHETQTLEPLHVVGTAAYTLYLRTALRQFECNEEFKFTTFATTQVANSEIHKQHLRVDATDMHNYRFQHHTVIHYLVINFTNKTCHFKHQNQLTASLETCGHVCIFKLVTLTNNQMQCKVNALLHLRRTTTSL